MKYLKSCTFDSIVRDSQKNSFNEYQEGHVYFTHIGTNYLKGIIYLRNQSTGKVIEIRDRRGIIRHLSELNKQPEQKHNTVSFDKTDMKHLGKTLDSYEGNIREDLMQPYNTDGSINESFRRKYGPSAYTPQRPD